jgi:phosphoglycolate phosphatase
MVKSIIFDFDGTLADSVDVIVSVYNQIADRHKFKQVSPLNIAHLKTLSINDRLKFLNVPIRWIPILTIQFLSEYRKNISRIAMIPGMKDILIQIINEGYDISIVSSNSTETIKCFLEKNELGLIKDVYSSSRLYKKDKVIKKVLKKKGIKNTEVIYVGDERRDIAACKICEVKSAWVSWGLDIYDEVNAPDYIAHYPKDILEILKENLYK